MVKPVGMLAVCALALILVGCAHSPQQLSVQPKVQVALNPVAGNQPVAVTVQDARSSTVLGTRGGIYPNSSSLTLSDRSIPAIRQEVEQSLRQLGFVVVQPGSANANSLTVNLAELSYRSPADGAYVTQADIGAVFTAEARGRDQVYNGRYSASAQHRFGYAPNQATNTKLVSEVMSDALSRMFRDQEIVRVLQR